MKLTVEIEMEDSGDDEQEITKVTVDGKEVEGFQVYQQVPALKQWNIFEDEELLHLIIIHDCWS